MKGAFFLIIKILLAAAVTIGLTELAARGLRLAPLASDRQPIFVEQGRLPWIPVPNSVLVGGYGPGEYSYTHSHNSLGFRDTEHADEANESTYRILAVGDSFTYGAGASFEDTWLVQLERALNTPRSALAVEIIKAGVPRYFTEPERYVVEVLAPRFKPKLILVGFNLSDVPDTSLGVDAVKVGSTGYLSSKEGELLGSFGQSLFFNSHVFRVLWNHYVSEPIAFQTMMRMPEALRDDGPFEDDWKAVERQLTDIQKVADVSGSALLVVHLPIKESWDDTREYAPKRLNLWCGKHGAYFLDALPYLRARGKRDEYYWPIDGHPNSKGYKMIAAAVLEGLDKLRLPPRQ